MAAQVALKREEEDVSGGSFGPESGPFVYRTASLPDGHSSPMSQPMPGDVNNNQVDNFSSRVNGSPLEGSNQPKENPNLKPGEKRKLPDADVPSEALPEVGDDNVFYEDDAHKQEDLRSSQDRNLIDSISTDPTKTLTSQNIGMNGVMSQNGEYQSEGELTLIPPLELLSRLFPTQKRSVMELILKGCQGNTLRAVECILPSHEKAIAALKSSEYPAAPYNPGMRPAFVPSQPALTSYPGAVRQAVYPMHGSHRFPYPMMEYMAHQNCGLRPKCNVDDDMPHKMAVKANEQHSNIIGKVCQECGTKCSPSSNFCSSCGKDLKET